MKVWLPTIQAGTGADTFNIRLCDALTRKGIACEISWFNHFYELAPSLLKSSKPPKDTTIIHCNSWNGYAFANKHIPLIVTEHLDVHDVTYSPYKTWLQKQYHRHIIKKYEKRSFGAAECVTCVSKYTAASIANTFSIKNCEILSTWVDTDVFSPTPYRNSAESGLSLLFVGNTSNRKGWDVVIKVMRELGSGFRLYYTGSPLRHLPDNMISVGRINSTNKLIDLYRRSDALLFPSRLEGLSQVVLESMSCGIPVITSTSSSMPEIITSGENGLLCEPGNTQAFVAAVKSLVANPDLAEELGKNARNRILEKYSEQVVIPKYIALYNSI